MYASTTTAAFGAEDFAVFRPVATMPNGDGDGAGSDGDEPHHRDGGDGDDRGYGGHGGKGYGDDWRGDWRHGKLASRLSLFYVVFLGGLFVASKFKPIPNLCTVVVVGRRVMGRKVSMESRDDQFPYHRLQSRSFHPARS